MWKLFNKWFGWEYAVVYTEFSRNFGTVRRIHTAADGTKYFRRGIYGFSDLVLYKHTYIT